MKIKHDLTRKTDIDQRGAALVTVLLISILLLTASVAMLTAVGANSKNTTDVLSETKAYYAAESGLRAGSNFFRNDSTVLAANKYSYAVGDPSLNTKLTYATVNGISQVAVGSEAGYRLNITDPDNSAGSIVYSTLGSFDDGSGVYSPTRVYPPGGGANTLTFSFNNQASSTASPPINNGQPFGSLQVVKTGTGASMSAPVSFRIDYVMSSPRPATRTIRGTIGTNGGITFLAPTYSLMGSTILLCTDSTSTCTPPTSANTTLPIPPLDLAPHTAALYGKMAPIEPYRLKVLATGYGPNGSTKQLELVIQRNLFNDLGSSAAITMIGPNAFCHFGPSQYMHIIGGSLPSVTVSDQAGLNAVLFALTQTSGTATPPPEIAGNDVPDWQQSPAAMDAFITRLKQSALDAGRYYDSTHAPSNFGNFTNGTGITFCDRSCTMSGGVQGGGILVVTGTLTFSDDSKFKGLILEVGQYVNSGNPGGIVRSGGPQTLTGNIVIAPYNPNNLAAGSGQPRYNQSGEDGDTSNSDVVVDQAYDGTLAITDFMLGVAEK